MHARTHGGFPNVHLPASQSRITTLEGGVRAFLRPSFSDTARSCEYAESIYVPEIELTRQVKTLMPDAIIDVGANIGLSSRALVDAFPSARVVIGIEAEKENYLVLEKNYRLWESAMVTASSHERMYRAIYAIASASAGAYDSARGISRLPGGTSASGIFSFLGGLDSGINQRDAELGEIALIQHSNSRTCVSDILKNYPTRAMRVVVKVDIEGGEEDLFSGNTDWLEQTVFLTVEVHDRMGAPRSSKNLLRNLVCHDFAIVPSEDILHCYNRKLLGI
jgi:hypothetical protein